MLVCGLVAAPCAAAETARLLFAGDVLLAREVGREIGARRQSPWVNFGAFKSADFAMVNFEAAVGIDPACDAWGVAPCFAVAPDALHWLADAGITAAGIANNHSADLGAAGRAATESALKGVGVAPLSEEASPGFVRFGSVVVGVVAISRVKGRDGALDPLPSVVLEQKLRLARAIADYVVVFIHWGSELKDWPQPGQETDTQWLIGQGVDVIIGSHPHVVIPPQCVSGHPVFYSLGNHVFDQKYAETKVGEIADCRIADGHMRCQSLVTHTPMGSSFPQLAQSPPEPALAECAVAAGGGLHVAGFRIVPAGERGHFVTGAAVLEGIAETGARGWRATGRALLAAEVAHFGDLGEALVTLERHLSPIDSEVGPRPYVYAVTPHGLIAKWRGTALAWPLIDVRMVEGEGPDSQLCALHRGDTFLELDPATTATRTAAYRWNGFGFSASTDAKAIAACHAAFPGEMPAATPQ